MKGIFSKKLSHKPSATLKLTAASASTATPEAAACMPPSVTLAAAWAAASGRHTGVSSAVRQAWTAAWNAAWLWLSSNDGPCSRRPPPSGGVGG